MLISFHIYPTLGFSKLLESENLCLLLNFGTLQSLFLQIAFLTHSFPSGTPIICKLDLLLLHDLTLRLLIFLIFWSLCFSDWITSMDLSTNSLTLLCCLLLLTFSSYIFISYSIDFLFLEFLFGSFLSFYFSARLSHIFIDYKHTVLSVIVHNYNCLFQHPGHQRISFQQWPFI